MKKIHLSTAIMLLSSSLVFGAANDRTQETRENRVTAVVEKLQDSEEKSGLLITEPLSTLHSIKHQVEKMAKLLFLWETPGMRHFVKLI